jgi:hypothetical protein
MNTFDWSPPVEELIKRIGEQAECYAILHKRAESYYAYFNHFIAIPVIILSTVSGSGNFIFGGDKDASLVVGAISILTGVISTLGTYFRFAQLAEGNRISGIQYNKLYQRISAELALTREHRIDANQLLTDIRETVERLEEVSPAIPTAVIDSFKRDYKQYENVSRPNIANGLDTIKINIQVPELPRSPVPSLSSPIAPVASPEEEKKPVSRPWK